MSVARATATARRRQQVKAPAARHRQVHPIRRNYLVEQHTTPGLRVDRAFASGLPTATGLGEAPARIVKARIGSPNQSLVINRCRDDLDQRVEPGHVTLTTSCWPSPPRPSRFMFVKRSLA